jgi:hypothetical protein
MPCARAGVAAQAHRQAMAMSSKLRRKVWIWGMAVLRLLCFC